MERKGSGEGHRNEGFKGNRGAGPRKPNGGGDRRGQGGRGGEHRGSGYRSGGKQYGGSREGRSGGTRYGDSRGGRYGDQRPSGDRDGRAGGKRFEGDRSGGTRYGDGKPSGQRRDDHRSGGKRYDDRRSGGKRYDDRRSGDKRYGEGRDSRSGSDRRFRDDRTDRNDRRHGGRWGAAGRGGQGGRSDRGPRDDRSAERTAPRQWYDKPARPRDERPRRNEQDKRKQVPSKASPARLAALDVVYTVRVRDAFAQELIASRIDGASLSPEDRAFATLLALGVASSYGTLDDLINRALNSPSDVNPDVRDALRISAYEMLFLSKAPHAAVDQGVELVRSFAPQATGLANAALRKMCELARSFPFGDPTRDVDALARLYAFPSWLAKRLIQEMGPKAAVQFMRASNEQAPLFVATNLCRGTEQSALNSVKRAGEEIRPVEIGGSAVPGCYLLPDSRSLLVSGVEVLLKQGKLIVADAASQLVAASVLPETAPKSVLEIGAGRATKTVLLQSGAVRKYGEQVQEYVTLDNHAFKMRLLLDRVEQCRVVVSEALTGDACELDGVLDKDRQFDLVFIDAPCSGLGTMRRHPEIRWRLKPDAFDSFAQTQLAMLRSAATHVAPGGTLAYATCTVDHEENADVVRAFLKSPEGASFELVPIAGRSHIATVLAPGSSDAHFAVRFVRRG